MYKMMINRKITTKLGIRIGLLIILSYSLINTLYSFETTGQLLGGLIFYLILFGIIWHFTEEKKKKEKE